MFLKVKLHFAFLQKVYRTVIKLAVKADELVRSAVLFLYYLDSLVNQRLTEVFAENRRFLKDKFVGLQHQVLLQIVRKLADYLQLYLIVVLLHFLPVIL